MNVYEAHEVHYDPEVIRYPWQRQEVGVVQDDDGTWTVAEFGRYHPDIPLWKPAFISTYADKVSSREAAKRIAERIQATQR